MMTSEDQKLQAKEQSGQPAPAASFDEEREARTNLLIADMLIALTGEDGYESAMNRMLEMVAEIVDPDRLSVFECGGNEAKVTFELCAEGVEPIIGTSLFLPADALHQWFKYANQGPVAFVPDASVVARISEPLYQWFVMNKVERFMAVPFYSDEEMVGFLGAYNYHLSEEVNIGKLFAAVSSFIGARIDNRRLIDSLDWAGKHDALTQLFNRRGFDLALSKLREEKHNGSFALALIDLDDFKQINDTLGHAAGDAALIAVARTMNEAFPDDALLSRNGGDEFLALVPVKASENVDELIQAFARNGIDFEYDGKQHHMTISVGYACFPEHASQYRELYPKADLALYAVKLTGKSGALRYSSEIDTRFRSRLSFAPSDLAENVPCGIAIHTAGKKGVILYVNDETISLTGCDDALDFMDCYGGMFWGVVYPDDRERIQEATVRHASNELGAQASQRFRLVTKTGDVKDVLAFARVSEIEGVGKVFYTILVSPE